MKRRCSMEHESSIQQQLKDLVKRHKLRTAFNSHLFSDRRSSVDENCGPAMEGDAGPRSLEMNVRKLYYKSATSEPSFYPPTFSRLKALHMNSKKSNLSPETDSNRTAIVRGASGVAIGSNEDYSSARTSSATVPAQVTNSIHVNPKVLKSANLHQLRLPPDGRSNSSIYLNRTVLENTPLTDKHVRPGAVEHVLHRRADEGRKPGNTNSIHVNPNFTSKCVRQVFGSSQPPAGNNPPANSGPVRVQAVRAQAVGRDAVHSQTYEGPVKCEWTPTGLNRSSDSQSTDHSKSTSVHFQSYDRSLSKVCSSSVKDETRFVASEPNLQPPTHRSQSQVFNSEPRFSRTTVKAEPNVFPASTNEPRNSKPFKEQSLPVPENMQSVNQIIKSNTVHVNRKFFPTVTKQESGEDAAAVRSFNENQALKSLNRGVEINNSIRLERGSELSIRTKLKSPSLSTTSKENSSCLVAKPSKVSVNPRKVVLNNRRRSTDWVPQPNRTPTFNYKNKTYFNRNTNNNNLNSSNSSQYPSTNNILIRESPIRRNINFKHTVRVVHKRPFQLSHRRPVNAHDAAEKRKKCVWIAPRENNAVSSEIQIRATPNNPYKYTNNIKLNTNIVLQKSSRVQSSPNTSASPVAVPRCTCACKNGGCSTSSLKMKEAVVPRKRKSSSSSKSDNTPSSVFSVSRTRLVRKTNLPLKRSPTSPSRPSPSVSNRISPRKYESLAGFCSRTKLDRRIKNSAQDSSLFSVSRTKLVRKAGEAPSPKKIKREPPPSIRCASNRAGQVIDRRPLNRTLQSRYSVWLENKEKLMRLRRMKVSPTLQIARLLKTKYNLMRNQHSKRFKIDRRQFPETMKPEKRFHGALPSTPTSNFARNRRKSITIGGISYNTSRLKLQRKWPRDLAAGKSSIIRVRGETFEIGSGGKTLKRIGEGPARLPKVYVGGVAFTRSDDSDTTLQRTNAHFVQQRLIQAKQRSIALLTKKLRKNNEPCPIYHRFGRCLGKEKGTCNRVHDPKRIALCKKFLQGMCDKRDCLMSHDVGPSKMPTCHHYLAGLCFRDNCPYLHVKLNSSAPICRPFLQGYCPDAEKCKKRHFEVCPEFEETSKCSKGTKSLKGAVKSPCKETRKGGNAGDGRSTAGGGVANALPPARYYSVQDESLSDVEEELEQMMCEGSGQKDAGGLWLRQRPRLGDLPGFIPLDGENADDPTN